MLETADPVAAGQAYMGSPRTREVRVCEQSVCASVRGVRVCSGTESKEDIIPRKY